MARYKPVEEGQGYFLEVFPEDQFEDNSIEKVINRFVEDHIELEPFSKKYRNDDAGQRAINPRTKLKVIFYAWVNGIKSSREIEMMMRRKHLGYVYLSGNTIIDHSTLCGFIDVFSKEITAIFSKLLMVLNEMGVIDWGRIVIDGTKIPSNASKLMTDDLAGFRKKLGQYKKLSAKLVERSRYLDRIAASGELNENEKRHEEEKIKRQGIVYASIMGKIETYEKAVEAQSIDPKKNVNLTDLDSALLRTDNGYIQGYNVQAAYSANDIIVDIEAVSSAGDQTLLEDRVRSVEAIKEQNSVGTQSVYIADKGYYSPERIVPLIKEGIETYVAMPITTDKSYEMLKHIERDGESLYYTCSNGTKVKGYFYRAKDSYRFDVRKGICSTCPLKSDCWSGIKENGVKKRFEISRNYVQNKKLWLDYQQKMESEEGKRLYNKRLGKEHNFHDLKKLESGGRISRRGIRKSQCEMVISAIVHNLKKLQKYLQGQGMAQLCPR
jgi:transposase